MAITTSRGRSCECPRTLLRRGCKEISDLYVIVKRRVPQLGPVDACEEWVCFYLLNSVQSQTVFGVCDQLSDQVSSLWTNLSVLWNHQVFPPVLNLMPGLSRLLGGEWRIPDKHFIKNDTHRPPIDSLSITHYRHKMNVYLCPEPPVPHNQECRPPRRPVSYSSSYDNLSVSPRLSIYPSSPVRTRSIS